MPARYAVWKGDKCLAIGTAREIAEKLKVKRETVVWWATPSAHKRADGEHPRGIKVAERV